MNGRYAEINFDGERWNVILFDTVMDENQKPLNFARSEQEFAKFGEPAFQLYVYRWCLEGVVTL